MRIVIIGSGVAELPDGKLYAFILPIRNQALWLAEQKQGRTGSLPVTTLPPSMAVGYWTPPVFTTKAKVHGFDAVHPYNV